MVKIEVRSSFKALLEHFHPTHLLDARGSPL